MKAIILTVDENQINEFLATPGIKISTKHVIPPDKKFENSTILFFYETAEDDQAIRQRLTIEQNAQLEGLIDLARTVSIDEKYTGLKNASQRQIYLLAKYNLPASDASMVSELLKPEMASVLGGA
jgi:hypothetical protein